MESLHGKRTRLFFVTDVHGSERCFLKFLNAGKAYNADVLILGGDLTGKMVVPIVEHKRGVFSASFLGGEYHLSGSQEVEALEKNIRAVGYYPYRSTPDEVEELSNDKTKVAEVFSELMCTSIQKWMDMADQKLRGTGIKCFVSAGNDDLFDIDPALGSSECVINPEGKVVNVDENHEMISCGFANMTPWKCPRDISDEELAGKIEGMTSKVKNMGNCIFNLHCPPHGSGIDEGPKLDETLKPVLGPGGDVQMIPTGSISIRRAIERWQPLLSLHGHIHESRGVLNIGRTLCANPGSEYTEGILRGFLVDLSPEGIIDYITTSG
jgi:hypothetical protein